MWKYVFPTDEDFMRTRHRSMLMRRWTETMQPFRRSCWLSAVKSAALKKHVDLPASQWVYGTSKQHISEAVEVVEHHANFQSVNAAWRGNQKKVSSNRLTANQREPWEATANLKLTRYQPRQLLTLVKTGSWKIWSLCSVFGCEVFSNGFISWRSSVDETMWCG